MKKPSLDRDRFRGALLGLAVGDALGTTVEFKSPGTFEPVTDMLGGGPFGLPPGAWTDDTSMALCLAESLVECQGFNPVDQLQRYVRWYREGYLSSTGACFDIGGATRSALQRFEQTGEPFPGDADPHAAGNGPLMKLAPVALAFARQPAHAIQRAGESARTTHGAPQAIDASRYFAGLLVSALNGAHVSQLLHEGIVEPLPGLWATDPLHPEIAAVAAGSFRAKAPPAIRGTGYVVNALEAALWALMHARTFEDGVLAAVNLGDDADTTAAIYGQLAGALYGADALPARWLDKLVMRDRIIELADELFALSSTVSPVEASAAARQSVPSPDLPDPPDLPGDSFWVLEDRLLAGPYPGAPSKNEAKAKLAAFLDTGVTCFVDLTEEGEGPPLHPYSALLRLVARERKARVTHLRLPIRDVDIPNSWQMQAILQTIRLALAEGETVYVHCWGGVGRTGTVVGCLLIEDGIPAREVLTRLAEMRRLTQRAHRPAPETHQQRTFVETWNRGTLALDDQTNDPLSLIPLPQDPTPVPSLGEIVASLRTGNPVVIEGPGTGWRVQALADRDARQVKVEVLKPEHGDTGTSLTAEQQRLFESLGFQQNAGSWSRLEHDEDEIPRLRRAAELMLAITNQGWGMPTRGSLRIGDVPPVDAPWEQIGEFAHTFDGYAHFGEKWAERFDVVRERYFETEELPDDIDELRACLFCEFRMDRFTWGDDVTLSEPDAEGVRHVINNPDFESSPTQLYRRAILDRLRELLGERSQD